MCVQTSSLKSQACVYMSWFKIFDSAGPLISPRALISQLLNDALEPIPFQDVCGTLKHCRFTNCFAAL